MDVEKLSSAIGWYAKSLVAVELVRFNVVHTDEFGKRGIGEEMRKAQENLIEELRKLNDASGVKGGGDAQRS